MFTSTRQSLRQKGILNLLPEDLPETTTLSELDEQLRIEAGPATQPRLENVFILKTCLVQDLNHLSRVSGDEKNVESIIEWISVSILPDKSLGSDNAATVAKSLDLTRETALYSLECLNALRKLSTTSLPPSTLHKLLLCAIVYSSRDAWSSDATREDATSLLFSYVTESHSSAFIIDYVLQTVLRPLFSRSRPSTLTSSGRKAMPTNDPPKRFDLEADKRDRPWKYETIYSIAVFEWVVGIASEDIVNANWNLFIPPLLTLIEDPDTPIRCRGLSILSTFLEKISPALLLRTGLGPVIEEAVVPTLMFLPSITPMDESVRLLPAGYRALDALGEARFGEGGEDDGKRIQYLHRITRQGILAAHDYASQYPSIVEILLRELSATVSKLGTHSVIHLKDTLPLIATHLSDPFTPPSLLHAALEALEAVIQNGWPRIGEEVHRRRIMLALAEAWGVVSGEEGEEGGEERGALKEHVRKVVRLFEVVLESDKGLELDAEDRKVMERLREKFTGSA